MKLSFIFTLLLPLSFLISGYSEGETPKASTTYYYGEVQFLSPDGKIPFGKTTSLVKRIVDPANDQIVEYVLQPPRNPKDVVKEIKTTLQKRPGTFVFDASDEDKSFNGQLTFSGGAEWAWEKWIYEINLKDGSGISGSGNMDSAGLHTRKTFKNALAQPTVLIVEDLLVIDEATYQLHAKTLLKK